ncbi:MAG: hypothetical protein PUF50_06695 [Erysipelotrichaceae bacterium]|nr:hypothetical protein [Erysipelotrichaceae bacterium]
METNIKRMIDVDKEVQKIIQSANETENEYKEKLTAEKQVLRKQYWDDAERFVQTKKKELSALIGEADHRSQEANAKAIAKMDAMFAEHEKEWEKELVQRCIGMDPCQKV